MCDSTNDEFDYAQMLGEIAINWNYLELHFNRVIYQYFNIDREVAAAVLATMGNVTKGEFLRFLIAKYETNTGIVEHVHHFIKTFDIIRENRNILQHSLPDILVEDGYTGQIYKRDRRGTPKIFTATPEDMEDVFGSIHEARGYALKLEAAIHGYDKPEEDQTESEDKIPHINFRELFASIDKPPLPRKINPTQIGVTPTDE